MSAVVDAPAEQVRAARAALAAGEVAILPTDTVYGLAAALDLPEGVEALYRLKGRPRSEPCQVLVLSPATLAALLAALDPVIGHAARHLLPGPATCIVDDPTGRFAAAAGDAPGSVGLRAPRVTGALAEVEELLVATSANEPGGADPALLEHVPEAIAAACGAAVDAGPLPGTASSVVDLRPIAAGGPARLVRAGPDPERVAEALAEVEVLLAIGG